MIEHRQPVAVRPSRVVILGASGFVGADLVRHLTEEGIETLALSSTDLDLCRPEAVEGLQRTIRDQDAVVIISALTPDRGRDVGTFMKNLTMGAHLGAFFQRSGCAHVIYVSSDAVYDDGASPLIREGSPCDPSTLHGLMHLARERMLAQAIDASKIPWLVLRPCPLYGAQDPHNSYGPNRFLRTAIRERRISLFGGGEERRDHVLIRDLSRLIGQCLLHRSEGLLNVATGTSHAFVEVAGMIAGLCDEALQIERLPRSAPVVHRHMEITERLRAFPRLHFTPLAAGLAQCLGAMAGHPLAPSPETRMR